MKQTAFNKIAAAMTDEEKGRMLLDILEKDRPNTAHACSLIRRGARLDIPNGQGMCAILRAVCRGHAKIAAALLKSGADPNAVDQNTGKTVLMWAAFWNRYEICAQLLRAGADVNAKNAKSGNTALHIAAHWGDARICGLFLEWNADASWRNKFGKTPADMAGHASTRAKLRACLIAAKDAIETPVYKSGVPVKHAVIPEAQISGTTKRRMGRI